jgi:protein-S-isoprenylcysteine O-methyltransferase Ste14
VRHPIYLGWFLLVFAVATMTMTRLAFALISCAYVLVAIPLEERSLLRNSAGTYADYMRKVPWRLVPRVY